MGYWQELPYRGDDDPRNTKPKRRFVNRKQQRKETIKSILNVVLFFSVFFGCIIFGALKAGNSTKVISVLVIGSMVILTLALGIASLNKFRKGYDVDISEESEKDKDEG